MASGDITLLKKFRDPINAMHTIGTSISLVLKSGQLVDYAIAGGAITTPNRIGTSDVSCIWTDRTYIYMGMHNGQLLRYTIGAPGTDIQLAKFDSKITAMAAVTVEQTTLLYLTCEDGTLHSYEI